MLIYPRAWSVGWEPNRRSLAGHVIGQPYCLLKPKFADLRRSLKLTDLCSARNCPMSRRIAHLALLLGLITAVGPFAIDIYLPALPTLGASLHASPALVQMSLTVFFVIVMTS